MEIIKNLAAKVYGMADEEVASLFDTKEDGTVVLKPNAQDELFNRDAQRITKIKEAHKNELTDKFNKGYQKAQAEILSKYEQKLKEQFSLNTDVTGDDLIAELAERATKKTGLKEDEVKLHPLYLSLEKQKNQEMKALADAKEAEKAQILNDFKRKETIAAVKGRINQMFNSMEQKPLDYAPGVYDAFISTFDQFDYQVDGNDIIPIKEGKRLEDQHGNPTDFNKFVAEKVNYFFKFPVQSQRTTTTGGQQQQTTGTVTAPKNMQEYNNAMSLAKTPEEKKAIIEAFRASQKQ